MPQMCPGCSYDNPDNAQTCVYCHESLRYLLGLHTILEGRYRVIRVLGCGGMGAVYLADDIRMSGRQVAVKENLNTTPQAQSQFQTEVNLMIGLDHPGLPNVSDQFTGPTGRQYLVMDYVAGETLEDVMNQHGPLPVAKVVTIVNQLLKVLEYLHSQPIIHRDIKPANIKIKPNNRVVLVDFGIAKVHLPGAPTQIWARGAGSPGFAPFEQYHGTGTDTRSDLYSLGAMMYYLLTGQSPPEAPDLAAGRPLLTSRKLRPGLPPRVQEVVVKAMALYPDDRYQSAVEMRQALDASTVSSTLPPTRPDAKFWSWPTIGGLSLIILLCVVLMCIALVWSGPSLSFLLGTPTTLIPTVIHTPMATPTPLDSTETTPITVDPLPTYTPTASMTVEVSPSHTPSPTFIWTATATSSPTLSPVPTATDTPTNIPVPTPIPTPHAIIDSSHGFVNVRSGPGLVYDPPLGKYNNGAVVQVIGKQYSPEGELWWLILFAAGSNNQGWIHADYAKAYGVDNVPWVTSPSPPTPAIPTATPIIPSPPPPTPVASVVDAVKDYYALIGQKQYSITWEMLSDEFIAQHGLTFQAYKDGWEKSGPAAIVGFSDVVENSNRATIRLELYYSKVGAYHTILYEFVRNEKRGSVRFDYWLFVDSTLLD